jgi:hypothetical protein
MKNTILCYVTSYSLSVYRRFAGTYWLCVQDWRLSQTSNQQKARRFGLVFDDKHGCFTPPNRQEPCTRPRGDTSQKLVLFTVTSVRTSKPTILILSSQLHLCLTYGVFIHFFWLLYNCVFISELSHACYMFRLSPCFWFNPPNKLKGHGIDSRYHWIFQLIFQPHYGPGVDAASNRNEYQESCWG